MLAYHRLGIMAGARHDVSVLRRADVAEHHGGIAGQITQRRRFHRRVPERGGELGVRHGQQFTRECPRVLSSQHRTSYERRVRRQLLREFHIPRAD